MTCEFQLHKFETTFTKFLFKMNIVDLYNSLKRISLIIDVIHKSFIIQFYHTIFFYFIHFIVIQ
jgi:hypothetical protein